MPDIEITIENGSIEYKVSFYTEGNKVILLDINGIDSIEFRKSFISEIAEKVHEKHFTQLYEQQQEKREFYDEGDR